MPAWITIVSAVLAGSIAGGVATIVAARIAARENSRTRVRDEALRYYAEALAALEDLLHSSQARYDEHRLLVLQKDTPPETARDLAEVRRVVNDARIRSAARQAPARLLASPEVEAAFRAYDAVMSKDFILAVKKGEPDEVFGRLDVLHDELITAMKLHISQLGRSNARRRRWQRMTRTRGKHGSQMREP